MSRTVLERSSRQVEILALRSLELANRVAAGEIAFLRDTADAEARLPKSLVAPPASGGSQ
jgi:hypothetical protein